MSGTAAASRGLRATTVRIPNSVYEQARHFVAAGSANPANPISLNDFFVTAIQAYVKLHTRREIDAAFAAMANDANYQEDATLLTDQFEASDWEALGLNLDQEQVRAS